MFQVIIRRLFWFIPVFFVVTGITFVTMHALPGGPFDSDKTPPALVAQMEATFGLSQPIHEQYFIWLSNVVRLRFGPSLVARGKPVESFLLPALWRLHAVGLAGAALRSVRRVAGGHHRRHETGRTGRIARPCLWRFWASPFRPSCSGQCSTGSSACNLGWLPVAKWGDLERWALVLLSHAILPAITLGAGLSAIIARLTRASLLQVLGEDYVRTAHAKGLSRRVVTVRHALRNSLIPVVTYMGPLAAAVLTGSLVVEQIFAIPGMGRFFVTSITSRDYPMVMAVVVIYALIIVIVNLIVDILYVFIDPRIGHVH